MPNTNTCIVIVAPLLQVHTRCALHQFGVETFKLQIKHIRFCFGLHNVCTPKKLVCITGNSKKEGNLGA
jgi:hypothetical protein